MDVLCFVVFTVAKWIFPWGQELSCNAFTEADCYFTLLRQRISLTKQAANLLKSNASAVLNLWKLSVMNQDVTLLFKTICQFSDEPILGF